MWKGSHVHHGREVSLYVFQPERPNGISVIVCPGGSYHWLSHYNEGVNVGKWLNANGITAFILFYRTAGGHEIAMHTRRFFRGTRHPDMITDAQRAMQFIRDNAGKYNIDPEKIGIMGFSAGGHLALSTACFCDTNYLKQRGTDAPAGLRPAFVAAIYPVVTMTAPYAHKRSRRGLIGDNQVKDSEMLDALSIEKHIPDNCPPVFFIHCTDDPVVPYQNSDMLDEALSQKGIPHLYIKYKKGKHGFGVSERRGSPECREWKKAFIDWLGALYFTSL